MAPWAGDASPSKSWASRTTRDGCTGKKRAKASWAWSGRSTGLCWRRRRSTGTTTSRWVNNTPNVDPFTWGWALQAVTGQAGTLRVRYVQQYKLKGSSEQSAVTSNRSVIPPVSFELDRDQIVFASWEWVTGFPHSCPSISLPLPEPTVSPAAGERHDAQPTNAVGDQGGLSCTCLARLWPPAGSWARLMLQPQAGSAA